MKKTILLSILTVFALRFGSNHAFAQGYCPQSLGGCSPVITRQITIDVSTTSVPCSTTIMFCIACCNGIGHIYFSQASWHPSSGCPDQWPIWNFLQRADNPTRQKILAAMITDASAAFAAAGNGCQINLEFIPPCPDESNQKWIVYKAACAHIIERADPVTGNPIQIFEGCGTYDYCNALLTACWDYSGPTPVLIVNSVSMQTESGPNVPACNYQAPLGTTEIEACRIVCP